MKILVITYSFEVNPGTFLQAYGVHNILKSIYHDPQIDFIKHKKVGGSGHVNTQKNKKNFSFFKAKLRSIPRKLKYELLYRKLFTFTKKTWDFFNYNNSDFKAFAENYDLIVVGSDTILVKLKKHANSEQLGLMWLSNIATKKIMLAASASPANFEITKSDKEEVYKSLNSFEYLGVRDVITEKLLTSKICIEKNKVFSFFDPTFYVSDKYFNQNFSRIKKLKRISKNWKTVLLNFGHGFKQKECLTKALKEQGFFIVSTDFNKDSDLNLLDLSPFEWGALFKIITFTVTDRFHDTVFTLRNNKIVYSVDWSYSRVSLELRQSKCSDILKKYGLEENYFLITEKKQTSSLLEKIKASHDSKVIRDAISKKNKDIEKINYMNVKELKTIIHGKA